MYWHKYESIRKPENHPYHHPHLSLALEHLELLGDPEDGVALGEGGDVPPREHGPRHHGVEVGHEGDGEEVLQAQEHQRRHVEEEVVLGGADPHVVVGVDHEVVGLDGRGDGQDEGGRPDPADDVPDDVKSRPGERRGKWRRSQISIVHST